MSSSTIKGPVVSVSKKLPLLLSTGWFQERAVYKRKKNGNFLKKCTTFAWVSLNMIRNNNKKLLTVIKV